MDLEIKPLAGHTQLFSLLLHHEGAGPWWTGRGSPGHPGKLVWKHYCSDVPGSSSCTGCYLVTNPVICLAEILFHSLLHNKLHV